MALQLCIQLEDWKKSMNKMLFMFVSFFISAQYYSTFHVWTTVIIIEGILPKGPYLPWVKMAGRALSAGYHRYNVLLPNTGINK